MTKAAAAEGPISGQVMFYSKPTPLNAEEHGKLGVDAVEKPYGFVSQTNVVPLTVTEFTPAALTYPIIFAGDNKQPVAVMGLRDGENLFVTPEGDFRGDAYVPAFVRRYPFVFANDDQQQRLILCIDTGAPFVREGGETALFEDGKPTAYTENVMQFCNNFEQERLRTDSFVKLLTDLDLFETREAFFQPRNSDGGEAPKQKLAEYLAVSEDKLRGLSAEKLAELRDNGALGQIYAHLISLVGWERLISLAIQQAVARGQVAGNA